MASNRPLSLWLSLWLGLAAALALVLAHPAAGGVGDKDLPLLHGNTRARVIYTVTGAVHAGTAVVTAIRCTSTQRQGTRAVLLGVEFFSRNGDLMNDVEAGEGVVTIPWGGSRIVTTGPTLLYGEDSIATPFGNFSGSARILADSKRVLCTAELLDPTTNPPSTWRPLPVFSKIKQRGQ